MSWISALPGLWGMRCLFEFGILLVAFTPKLVNALPVVVTCPEPEFVLNGYFDVESCCGVNDTVVYSCEEGYFYTGTDERVCQHNGTWSGNGGICAGIPCDDLPELQYGSYSKDPPYVYGDKVVVTCDEGHVYLNGTDEFYCLGHEKWTGIIGSCKSKTDIQCPFPEIPHILQSLRKTYRYEEDVYMTCQEGYTYNGSISLKCQATGLWSGILGHCRKIICPNVKLMLEHGIIYESDKANYDYGDALNLTCFGSYIYNGSIPVCGKDGKWNSPIESCLHVRSAFHYYSEESKLVIFAIAGIFGIILSCTIAIAILAEKWSRKR